MAYGTFDLLHEGHLHFLRHARAQCDSLIVAIDFDGYARERKGWGRPVEDQDVRSHSLAATGLVNLVIAVDSRDRLADAVAYYQPDILFAADNGQITAMPGHGDAPAIVLIPVLEGVSTTAKIKERLQ